MTHLTDRHIVEVRDGLPVDAAVKAHLDTCAECQSIMEAARAREATIRSALSAIDEPMDTDEARVRVRMRLESAPAVAPRGARSRVGRWSLGKAAALLLVAAGAASAIPGSPIRVWLRSEGPAPTMSASESVVVEPEFVGGRLTVTEGLLAVELIEVPAGTRVTVLMVDGSTVTVRAAPGSGFSYGESEVRASIAGGPVTVDLPRGVTSVSLSVNGRIYLQGAGGALNVTGPIEERDGDMITFAVGG